MNPLILHDRTAEAIESLYARTPQVIIISGQAGVGKGSVMNYIAAHLVGVEIDKLPESQYVRILGGDNETVSIDEVRELQHFLSLKASGSRATKRVVCIIEAGRMAIEAQNALLKTLEEPPEDAVIILTTRDENSLLSTVRSRSHTLSITAPDKKDLQAHFLRQGYKPTAINRALMMSGGLPGLMTAMLEQDSDHPLVKAAETAHDVLKLDTFGRLALVDVLAKQKELSRDTLFILQQMAMLSLADETKKAAAQKQWRAILKESFNAAQTLSETNATPKLVLTHFMLAL